MGRGEGDLANCATDVHERIGSSHSATSRPQTFSLTHMRDPATHMDDTATHMRDLTRRMTL